MKLRVVLEAEIEDDPQRVIQELRRLIAENESLANLKITGGKVEWPDPDDSGLSHRFMALPQA